MVRFAITNVGSAGVLFGSPIMNKGNTAISATGAIIDELKLNKEGAVENRKVMYLSIADWPPMSWWCWYGSFPRQN
nr:2-oxo acid dehydrogenase subunit E2 [Mycoplasmopsis bovis]